MALAMVRGLIARSAIKQGDGMPGNGGVPPRRNMFIY
jgi:hypothetical protein